ncbi:MAG: adenylate/guanylate cyclase domain-containing protein, partial [Myxococcota bacterium]
MTVLFADVKGSMELAEALDPEEWHAILDRFFRVLSDGVHRYEGTVNQYTGDGIMALFGAPIAHEDHAQRACHAALHLTRALRQYTEELRAERGLDFAVRIGLNSGEVVVGSIGDDLRMDYTAQGHTVGLAARMEGLASPGGICLTGRTVELAKGFFRFRARGTVEIRGLREAVKVYGLEGLGPMQTRFDVSRAQGLSRIVGRDQELDALERARAGARARGQVVAITGEAGVGKSRLLYELVQGCRSRGIRVLEGRALPHRQMIAFSPWIELLRGAFGIEAHAGVDEIRARLEGPLARLAPGFEGALPLMSELLSGAERDPSLPPLDPEARQRRIGELVREILRMQAGAEGTLLALEDIQWLDAASARLLEECARTISSSPVLVVVTCRTEARDRFFPRLRCRELPLWPLPPDEIDRLLRELLGPGASLRELASRIRERTGGNPFFVEEVVRSLVEAGALQGERGAYRRSASVDALVIPESVHAVLAARMDRLEEREKAVLQTAAIMGKEFEETLLSALSGLSADRLAEALDQLQRNEFIEYRSPIGGATYAFKHPLTQEVAYRSQLGAARTGTHARLAELLEAGSRPGGSGHGAAVIAHHWERGGDPLRAARFSVRAARHAAASDPAQALLHWRQAQSLAAALSDSDEAQRLELTASMTILGFGWREGMSDEDAGRLFAHMLERIRAIGGEGQLRWEALARAAYGRVLANTNADAYLAHTRAGLQLAREAGDEEVATSMRAMLSQGLRQAGRLSESLAICDELLQGLKGDPEERLFGLRFSPTLWLRAMRGQTLLLLGRLGEARDDLDCVIQTATERDDVELLVAPRYMYTDLCWVGNDPVGALAPAEEAVAIADRLGSTLSLVYAGAALGFANLLNGDAARAADQIDGALRLSRDKRVGAEIEARLLAHLAEAQLQVGEAAQALESAELAVEIARRRRTRVFECQAELVRARVSRLGGGPAASREGVMADATAALDRAAGLVEETGARVYAPFLHLERARIADARGQARARVREIE